MQWISTHTLRGERDTAVQEAQRQKMKISTHTLRGERDFFISTSKLLVSISTHTLRGERDFYISHNLLF